ncbi:MAG: methyltransferase [Rhizobacter sp.]|nr:methyltransferase [Rhizobacter sp.]
MPATDTLSANYYDDVYRAHDDPWDFETSEYERDKYRETLAALDRDSYRNAFEVGCSIGVLTALLAPRCQHLLAVDVSEAPLAKARRRCADLPQVELKVMRVPQEFATGPFDLIMLSEVAYYWSRPDLEHAIDQVMDALETGGQVLLVHWTDPVHDYPLTGDQVHDLFEERGDRLAHKLGKRHEKYRLDLFEKKAG